MIRTFSIVCFFCFSTFCFSQDNIFDIARSGTVSDVKQLMKINADTINSIEKKTGYSPLILACYRGNDDVAKYLANHVDDINESGGFGTALMAAVYKKREELVSTLLKLDANPNKADANGTTPLHYAVILRSEKIIELLLKANADVTLKDNRELTAKDYALMTKNEAIIKLFSKKK